MAALDTADLVLVGPDGHFVFEQVVSVLVG